MTNIVAVSGGFDPLHEGHIRYLRGAWEIAQINDAKVMVILNTDKWLEKKGHGHPYYSYEQRAEILEAIKYVDIVVPQIGEEMSIAESLRCYQPDVFAKGGDRTIDNLPEDEVDVCNQLGITIITGVGGTDKPNSSRWVIEKINNGTNDKMY
jgi:D-beta-D-heptose 7-phosphate kinase/D-beta-D-heptose 1-phosphate adenosyltransferase